MIISKKNLLNALDIVKPGLASKAIVEQSTSFAFMKDKIVTFNGKVSISHPVEGLDLYGLIKADELYSLLSKLKKDEIEISIDGNELLLQSGKAKAAFTLQTEINLPLEEIQEKGKWKDLPEGFVDAMEFAMGSCTSDMSKPILTCVHVNKEGFIEASDWYRISKTMLDKPFPIDTFLIPAINVVPLIKLNPTKIAQGKGGWIHFKTDNGTILSCTIFGEEDSFPDTSPFIKVKGPELIFPRTMLEILDKAMIFCKRDHLLDEFVDITLEDKKLSVKSQSESGRFEEEASIRYSGETISFSIRPYLLKGILSKTLSCTIAKDRLKFSGDNWAYVTLLTSK